MVEAKVVINFSSPNDIQEVQEVEKKEEKNIEKKQTNEKEKQEIKATWSLEIPKINLIAEISEGTTEEILNKYIGHFENTSRWNGNVGLAAHNRRISCKLFWQN